MDHQVLHFEHRSPEDGPGDMGGGRGRRAMKESPSSRSASQSPMRWKKSNRRNRPNSESARRFVGRISWNGMRINKQEMMHSIAFRSSNWIDLLGFEMLSSDRSFRMTFTVTKGQGVLGKIISKGTAFVSPGDILHPSRFIKLRSPERLQPNSWYCVNVIMEIHEYEMFLVTSAGTEGLCSVTTDSGVRIEYSPGLESCFKTDIRTGQIAGIVLRRIDPEEEQFLLRECTDLQDTSCSVGSVRDASVGESVAVLPVNIPDRLREISAVSPAASAVMHKTETKNSLPPLAGVMAPPIRSEQALKHMHTYKY